MKNCHPIIIELLLISTFLGLLNSDNIKAFDQEQWFEPRPEKGYKSLSEERFQMECAFFGIKGERKKEARKIFEESDRQRELIKADLAQNRQSAAETIKRIIKTDIKYYELLTLLIEKRKYKNRHKRILDILRKASEE